MELDIPAFWHDEDPAVTRAPAVARDLAAMFARIDMIGHDPSDPGGGYHRSAWTSEDLLLREWFAAQARELGLEVVEDSAGNQWAWWGAPTPTTPGVSTGSHLDSVPDGGAFDGPLGVLSALAAVRHLRRGGFVPKVPLAVLNTSDEEGARFGIACFGTRVLTGVLPAREALARTDASGETLRSALEAAGVDPGAYGPQPQALALTRAHVELHVEQGYALADTDEPVAVATHIWPHGRWRVDVSGTPDHAGTTPMERRDDALLKALAFPAQARASAQRHGARATVGRMSVEPGGTNVIPSHVTMWLDARASTEEGVRAVLEDLAPWHPRQESWTPSTHFDADLRDLVAAVAGRDGGAAPVLGTAAGHDAGILQEAGIPTAMIFVRNQTGASHTPAEFASLADCVDGVLALERALMALTETGQ